MKEKLKQKFKNSTIAHKMLTVYVCFAAISFFLALLSLQVSFSIYSQELYEKSTQELDFFSQNINRDLKEAESINYTISMDTLVQQKLAETVELKYPSTEYNQNLFKIRSMLMDEYDPQSCVKSIIYIDLHGNQIEVGTSAWEISDESIQKLKAKMVDAKGAYVTYGPTKDCPFLLTGRVVRNRLNMSLDDLGMLIFVCDVSNVIAQNKSQLEARQATVYVYSEDCIVYQDADAELVDKLPDYAKSSGYKIVNASGRKYFVSYLYAQETDWEYVNYFPYSEIYGQVQTMQYLLLAAFILIFFVLVLCMRKVASVITEPLEHLTQSMQIVEEGNFTAAKEMLVVTDRKDEIGILSREFQTMIETVDDLIKENYEKQILIKDTKYKMLRAQINPHFLYNTLNVIHWMIRAKRNEEAGKMIVELGAILHYSFAQTPYATVQDEIDMIKSYINIQKTRYRGRIEFDVTVDGNPGNYLIPRMILQPLVENSISYGAEPYLDLCSISVNVAEKEHEILMTVKDTGAGMSEEELKSIRNMTFVPKGHGIGLKNIAERLKMDDAESTFQIESRLGEGTCVIIQIHKKMRDDGNVQIDDRR